MSLTSCHRRFTCVHISAMEERHRRGILNHCDYPIHTSRLEGINNKIKVIKCRACGYHDERHLVLKRPSSQLTFSEMIQKKA